MGCAYGREQQQVIQQQKIIQAQRQLGFSQLKINEIDKAIHRFSIDYKLTISQFQAVFRQLKIEIPKLTAGGPLADFYKSFYTSDRKYMNVRKLETLAVILAKGSPKQKAVLLFQTFDDDASGSIQKKELNEMINNLMHLSLITIPSYAQGVAEEKFRFPIRKYSEKLQQTQKSLLNYFRILLNMQDKQELLEEDIIKSFKNKEVQKLVDSSKLRLFAFEKYREVVLPVQLVKNYVVEETKGMEYKPKIDYPKKISRRQKSIVDAVIEFTRK